MQEDWNIILSVLESPDSSLIGQQKVFSTSPITIGRAEENDFTISDPSISRNHSIIRITNDYTRVFITDSSTYGTEVSGKMVPKGPGSGFTLTEGDIVKLGNTKLRFELKLKLSVQSTFIGQVDRDFLESPQPSSELPPAQREVEVQQEETKPEVKTQNNFNPFSITIIVICFLILVYLIFFG